MRHPRPQPAPRPHRTLWRSRAALAAVIGLFGALPAPAVAAGQSTVTFNPAVATLLKPATAELQFSTSGDIPYTGTRKYFPDDKPVSISFETDIQDQPRIKRLMWQVSRNPFYGPLNNPVGLVAKGFTTHRYFSLQSEAFFEPRVPKASGHGVDPNTLQKVQPADGGSRPPGAARPPTLEGARLRLHAAPQAAAATTTDSAPAPTTALNAQALLHLRRSIKAPADKAKAADNLHLHPAALAGARFKPGPTRFYVRVVPVVSVARGGFDQTPAVTGAPSRTLEIVFGDKPEPKNRARLWSREVVSRQSFDLRLVSFDYHPSVLSQHWPPGCKEIPRDDGTDLGDIVSDIPGAVVDGLNWVADAYTEIKSLAVSVVGTLLPFVPEEVLSLALDTALAAAGIPPSIPNFDQLMSQGADYLATQIAAQIPVPATGALANMALEQAREEIRDRTKAALLDTARKLAAQRQAKFKWCSQHYDPAWFEVTLRNAASTPVHEATLTVHNSGSLLNSTYVQIGHMAPGQTFTIPVAFSMERNVRYRWVSQMPQRDRFQAEVQWWTQYVETPVSFSLSVPRTATCYGDGHCEGTARTLLKTPTRVWEDGPAWHYSG